MAVFNPYQQYRQNSVTGANPGQLTLMLYNGAIKFTKIAIIYLEKKDYEGVSNAIIRTKQIILYLNETLNHQYEISEDLSSLYDYIYNRLVKANVKKDPVILEEVSSMIEELRDTWMTVLNKNK